MSHKIIIDTYKLSIDPGYFLREIADKPVLVECFKRVLREVARLQTMEQERDKLYHALCDVEDERLGPLFDELDFPRRRPASDYSFVLTD
jgi:hypothetical protein